MFASRYHQAIHGINTKHQCPHCDRGFVRRAEMRVHLKSKHGITYPFKCMACDGAFTFLRSLKIHFKTVHGSRAPYRNFSGQFGTKTLRNADRSFAEGKNTKVRDRRRRKPESRTAGVYQDSQGVAIQGIALSDLSGEDDDGESDMDDEMWYRGLQEELRATEAANSSKEELDEPSSPPQLSSKKSSSSKSLLKPEPRQNVFSLFGNQFKPEDHDDPEQCIDLPSPGNVVDVGGDEDDSVSVCSLSSHSSISSQGQASSDSDKESAPSEEEPSPASSPSSANDCSSETRSSPAPKSAVAVENDADVAEDRGAAASASGESSQESLASPVRTPLADPSKKKLTIPITRQPLLASMTVSAASGEALSGLRKSIWQALSSQANCS